MIDKNLLKKRLKGSSKQKSQCILHLVALHLFNTCILSFQSKRAFASTVMLAIKISFHIPCHLCSGFRVLSSPSYNQVVHFLREKIDGTNGVRGFFVSIMALNIYSIKTNVFNLKFNYEILKNKLKFEQ